MNLLMDPLPQCIVVDGVQYPIHTSHRNWMRFDLLLSDEGVPLADRLLGILPLCYQKDLPPQLEQAIQGAVDFYLCKDVPQGEVPQSGANEGGGRRRIYSFAHDAPYIYAAFLSQYGIDLTAATLHWWQFHALFASLSEDTKFSKIMGYRSMDVGKLKDKEQKAFYRRMQRLYALPDLRSDGERDGDMLQALSRLF